MTLNSKMHSNNHSSLVYIFSNSVKASTSVLHKDLNSKIFPMDTMRDPTQAKFVCTSKTASWWVREGFTLLSLKKILKKLFFKTKKLPLRNSFYHNLKTRVNRLIISKVILLLERNKVSMITV